MSDTNEEQRRSIPLAAASAKDKGNLVEDVVALLYAGEDTNVQTRVHLPVVGDPERTREIDVLVSGMFAGLPIRIAIECKNYTKPIGVGEIGEFIDKLTEIGIPLQLGIYVTASRYTSGAMSRAAAAGVRTLVIKGLTASRMALEVQRATQSVVNLLLEIVQVQFKSSSSTSKEGALLTILDQDHNIRGHLPDLVWADWRDGKLHTTLGEWMVRLRLPKGWSFSDGPDIKAWSVKVIYRVWGLVITYLGESANFGLADASTGQAERFKIRTSFKPGASSLPVEVIGGETELSELLENRSNASVSLTIGRNRLPRILYEKLYWPPSDRTLQFLAFRFHQEVKRGRFDFATLQRLSLADVEGTDLNRIADPITPGHPASRDSRWSPTRSARQKASRRQ